MADIYCGAQTGEWLSKIHQAGGEAGELSSEIAALMLVMLMTLKTGGNPTVFFDDIISTTAKLRDVLPEEFKSGAHLLDNIDDIMNEYRSEQ